MHISEHTLTSQNTLFFSINMEQNKLENHEWAYSFCKNCSSTILKRRKGIKKLLGAPKLKCWGKSPPNRVNIIGLFWPTKISPRDCRKEYICTKCQENRSKIATGIYRYVNRFEKCTTRVLGTSQNRCLFHDPGSDWVVPR